MSKLPDHPLHHHDHRESVKHRTPEKQKAIEKMYKNIGETLGWTNITTDQKKLADIELYLVTGGDLQFILTHHRVRDLLEANKIWNGTLFKGYDSRTDIYKQLDDKGRMPVKLLDENGKETDRTVDLTVMARLLRIEEKNRLLGDKKLPTAELRRRFFAGEPLKVDVGKPKEKVDLAKECPPDNLQDFDFDAYLEIIRKNQIGLQYMGGLRDEVTMQRHHAENGGHASYVETGRLEYTGFPERLWMPNSGTIAEDETRGDLQKADSPYKAAGHVHEVGNYCEDNGTTVKFSYKLLKKHRNEVSLRQLEKVNARMFKAAVGLGREELMTIVSDKEIPGFEDRGKMNMAVLGGNRKGAIYAGLHYTYDKAMEDLRGKPLTDEEADDKFFTDIIAPFITSNPTDWLMCFAKAASGLGYKAEEAVAQDGHEWDKFGKDGKTGKRGGQKFCVAIPCRKRDADDKVNGLKYFFNYSELINYVNERIEDKENIDGGVEGIDRGVKVTYKGMSEDQIKAELLDMTQDEIEAEKIDSMEPEEQKSFVALMNKIFPDNTENALQAFLDEGERAQVQVGAETKIFIEYIQEKLRSGNFSEIAGIVGTKDDKAGKEKLIKLLKRMTREMKEDVVKLIRTGEIQDKREVSSIDKEIKEMIDQQALVDEDMNVLGLAENQKALIECAPLIKPFDPDAIGEQELPDGSGRRELAIKDPHNRGWADVMNKMAQIKLAIKNNERVRSAIGMKAKEPKWLLREALILGRKFELLKALSL